VSLDRGVLARSGHRNQLYPSTGLRCAAMPARTIRGARVGAEDKGDLPTREIPMDPRPEQQCFDELAELCKSPGYAHAIAAFCFRDHVVAYGDELRGKEYAKLFRSDRLIRTEISTLIGLMLRAPRDLSLPTIDQLSSYLERSDSLLRELHEAIMLPMTKHMKDAIAKGAKPDENPFASAEAMREPIFYSAESAYSFQYRDFAELRYAYDEEWLRKQKRFTSLEARRVISGIGKFLSENLVAKLKGLRGKPPAQWTMLEGFEFSIAQISAYSDVAPPTVQAVVDAFTFAETGNPSFVSLHDFNEANAFPIIQVDGDKYLLFLYVSLTEAFYDSPFYWMIADKAYASTASANRGKFTEAFTSGRFEHVFGKEHVFTNVDVWESKTKKTKVGEIDTLVLFADRAIVVQAKSKKLTLLARKGNDLQLQGDFKDAVQDACDQAIDCSTRLASGTAVLTNADGKEIAVPSLRAIHPICVVSEHYPALSFQARNFLKFSVSSVIQPPLVCDVFLIDVVTEFLDTPLRCLSYLELRARAGDDILLSHEITALGFHLKQNLWLSDDYDMVVLEDDISTDVDIAMAARRDNVPGKKTPPGILTKLRGLSVGRIIEQIETKSDPGAIGIGLELLKLNSESVANLSAGIDKIASLAKDGKEHDLTVSTKGSSGITIHCNSLPDEIAAPRLKNHCEIRKYGERARTWFGLALAPRTSEPRFGVMLDYPWQQNETMDQLVARLPKAAPAANLARLISQKRATKIGRNEKCPCGSGHKYKRCCLRGR
jgi:hypothetical protein